MLAFSVKQSFTRHWKEYGQQFRTVSYRRKMCQRTRRERSDLGILQKGGEIVEAQMLCRTSNSEVVLIFLKRTRNLLTRTAGICKEQIQKSKELISRHVQNLPTSQLKNSRESCRISVRLRTRRSRIYCGQLRIPAHDEQERIYSRWKGYYQKIKRTHRHHDR